MCRESSFAEISKKSSEAASRIRCFESPEDFFLFFSHRRQDSGKTRHTFYPDYTRGPVLSVTNGKQF